jgi:hypothetical protein
MFERDTMAESMRKQLEAWTHLAGDGHVADRELLMTMAEGIDAARESVSGGSAALPLINACRYLFETLRKLRPADDGAEDDGFDAPWDD